MHIIQILSRIRNLLLHPDKEWEVIAAENTTRKDVFTQFVLPLLVLTALASVIGSVLFASRNEYSFGYVFGKVAILCCSLSTGLLTASFLITEMTRQLGLKDHHKTFALMAYASGAIYIVMMLVALFPFFSELMVLGLYAFYLYWCGVPYMIHARGAQQMTFCILSFVIVAIVFGLAFYFFGHIFRALFI